MAEFAEEITGRQELSDRLSLIEGMIAEGRQTTENWGWSFVLWGVALYVASGWTMFSKNAAVAWPVTMIAAGVLNGILATRQARRSPPTTVGRAMGAIWSSLGISLFLFGMCMGISHRAELHVVLAADAVMLGMANAISSGILRWKMQFACALVWWAATVAAFFGTAAESSGAFLIAIFLCQIVFGLYLSFARPGRGTGLKAGAHHA
jgi:hypothetical protein